MSVLASLAFFYLFQAIINALGVERRNRVLAGLYMGRSDTQLVVRQASLHVWKIVVSNTPRTLREILPTLFGLLLGFLASTCADKRSVSVLHALLSAASGYSVYSQGLKTMANTSISCPRAVSNLTCFNRSMSPFLIPFLFKAAVLE